jgi:hypothetical protein
VRKAAGESYHEHSHERRINISIQSNTYRDMCLECLAEVRRQKDFCNTSHGMLRQRDNRINREGRAAGRPPARGTFTIGMCSFDARNRGSTRPPFKMKQGIEKTHELEDRSVPISEGIIMSELGIGESAPATGMSPYPIIGNRKSHIFHRPDCSNYSQVAPGNRVAFNSVAEAEEAGYRVAGSCSSG